jgi:hypothetical protein
VVVNDVKLYIATVQMVIPDSIVELNLNEIQVQSKTISAGSNNLQFTVPPSTTGISIFVQGNDAGSSARVPPTMFVCKDGSQNKLTSLQLTYANLSKPSTNWASRYNETTNQIQQRYLQTLQESGIIDSEGGAESLDDYIKRGCLYYYSYNLDRDNLATQAQLQITLSAVEADANVFLVSHYRKLTEITTSNGMIQAVRSLVR